MYSTWVRVKLIYDNIIIEYSALTDSRIDTWVKNNIIFSFIPCDIFRCSCMWMIVRGIANFAGNLVTKYQLCISVYVGHVWYNSVSLYAVYVSELLSWTTRLFVRFFILISFSLFSLFSVNFSQERSRRGLYQYIDTSADWIVSSPVLLSSRKVIVLEDPRGPIFKSLSLSSSLRLKSLSLSLSSSSAVQVLENRQGLRRLQD